MVALEPLKCLTSYLVSLALEASSEGLERIHGQQVQIVASQRRQSSRYCLCQTLRLHLLQGRARVYVWQEGGMREQERG